MSDMKNKEITISDLHSHILFGIDDGSRNIDESIDILKTASKEGVTKIMLTPHYMENTKYVSENNEKIKLFQVLKDKCKEYNIPVELYLGNEIYLTENILELLKKGHCLTLNQTSYVLVELPMYNELLSAPSIIYDMIEAGLTPIIAHPERYRYFQNDITKMEEFLEMGAYFQGNYKSLFGYYGKDAKKTLEKLLKNDYIQFLGSDTHRNETFDTKLLLKKLKKIVKKDEKIEKLLEGNFEKLLQDEIIG